MLFTILNHKNGCITLEQTLFSQYLDPQAYVHSIFGAPLAAELRQTSLEMVLHGNLVQNRS